jgi:hypothetical protein
MEYKIIFDGIKWEVYFGGVFLCYSRRPLKEIKAHATTHLIPINPSLIDIPEEIEKY